MFKRVLVLVLFLFGVFWWLTNRGGEDTEVKDTNVTVEETSEVEVDSDEENEASETEAEAETETEEDNTQEVKAVETVAPVVTATTTTSAAPVVNTTPATAPVTPAPVAKPVVVTPSVPDRTTDVKVYVYEWNVDLSDKTIPAGTVNFTVQNDGRFTHDFSLSSHGNLGKVMPNETKTFTVKLQEGEYEAFSKRRQDYERGVTETFTVTP